MDGDDGRATDEHRTNVNSPQQLYENNPNEQDEIAETDGFRLTRGVSEDQQEILTILKKKLEDVGQLKPVNLRNIDRRSLKEKTKRVNEVIGKLESETITDTNNLILAGANAVADLIQTKVRKGKNEKVPWWKRRIQSQIDSLRKDISKLDQWNRNKLRKENVKEKLNEKYKVNAKGIRVVIEELKQRVKAKSAKIRKYEDRNNTFQQNRLFQSNQKRLFEKLEGYEKQDDITPDSEESKIFWSNIWDQGTKHNEKAKWLEDVKEKYKRIDQQDEFSISKDILTAQLKKMPKWKACGPDGVHGYWLKEFSSLHERLAVQLDVCLSAGDVPVWMTKGRTSLILKDKNKGNIVTNFRPITCLPMVWKLLTGIISEKIYYHLESKHLLPEEQKGCRKGSASD